MKRLEFKNKNGGNMFCLEGFYAERCFEFLNGLPEMVKRKRKAKDDSTFLIFDAVAEVMHTLEGKIAIHLEKGSYVKILL